MTEMMNDVAEIRLPDVKAPLELTDDQITAFEACQESKKEE